MHKQFKEAGWYEEVLSNAVYLDKLVQCIHAFLKPENVPTETYETKNLFVPKCIYQHILKPILVTSFSRNYKINDHVVHAFEDIDVLHKLIPKRYLSATWSEIRTTVLVNSGFPFSIR